MPNWQPNWNDVQWNQGAAREASAALRRAAARLRDTWSERQRLAAAACEQWRGRYRDEFDVALRGMGATALNLADSYEQKANEIDSASRRAEAEQRHRDAERDRWRREKADEDRRRREEEEQRGHA
jgi:uncharacterized protein YukE